MGNSISDPTDEPVSPIGADDSALDTGDDSTGDSTSMWCELARGVDEASSRLDETDLTDPDSVEAAIDEMHERMLAAWPAAPAELTDAVEVSRRAFGQLCDALIAADWDFVDADLSAFDEIAADLNAATAEIDGYNDRVCGTFLVDADAGDDGIDPGADSIRDQTVAALVGEGFSRSEAECLFDNIDFTDREAAFDVELVTPVFDSCGIDLARLDELGG